MHSPATFLATRDSKSVIFSDLWLTAAVLLVVAIFHREKYQEIH